MQGREKEYEGQGRGFEGLAARRPRALVPVLGMIRVFNTSVPILLDTVQPTWTAKSRQQVTVEAHELLKYQYVFQR